MMRSRLGSACSTVSCSLAALPDLAERGLPAAAASAVRAIAVLATVPPRDHNAKENVQPAESRHEKYIAPSRRHAQSDAAEQHEAQPHHRHNANRKCPARDDCGSIQQQPQTGKHAENPGRKEI